MKSVPSSIHSFLALSSQNPIVRPDRFWEGRTTVPQGSVIYNGFVIYGRTLKIMPEIRRVWGHYDWFDEAYSGRAVIRSISSDFLEWAPADFIMGPDLHDPISTQIYSMNVFPYEGIYLGLVQRYISKPGIGTLDIQLAISRDGIHFERPFRDPLFPLGEIGTWDRFMLHSMSGPPLRRGNELHFYYGGRNFRHRPTKIADAAVQSEGNIGLATMLQDRVRMHCPSRHFPPMRIVSRCKPHVL